MGRGTEGRTVAVTAHSVEDLWKSSGYTPVRSRVQWVKKVQMGGKEEVYRLVRNASWVGSCPGYEELTSLDQMVSWQLEKFLLDELDGDEEKAWYSLRYNRRYSRSGDGPWGVGRSFFGSSWRLCGVPMRLRGKGATEGLEGVLYGDDNVTGVGRLYLEGDRARRAAISKAMGMAMERTLDQVVLLSNRDSWWPMCCNDVDGFGTPCVYRSSYDDERACAIRLPDKMMKISGLPAESCRGWLSEEKGVGRIPVRRVVLPNGRKMRRCDIPGALGRSHFIRVPPEKCTGPGGDGGMWRMWEYEEDKMEFVNDEWLIEPKEYVEAEGDLWAKRATMLEAFGVERGDLWYMAPTFSVVDTGIGWYGHMNSGFPFEKEGGMSYPIDVHI